DREYTTAAALTGKSAISDVVIGPLRDVPIVTISTPMFDPAHEVAGVAGGSLDLSKLKRFVEEFPTLADARVTVLDQRDRVIYTSGETSFTALQSLARDD